MTNERFHALFGGPPRSPESLLTPREMNLAASIQAVAEEAVLRLARSTARETKSPNLCLAGGVALNCVANGKVLRDGAFRDIWIQPAAGDAGGAVGAALAAYHWHLGKSRDVGAGDGMSGAYLGPGYPQAEIERRLAAAGAVFEVAPDEAAMVDAVAGALAGSKAVGWFQGRMEFGPRALGARSILGDPRADFMQKQLNLKVKYRESFRPFAPAIRAEDVADWFEIDRPSPYMLLVADVKKSRQRAMSAAERALFGIDRLNVVRSEIPAVTHVDYSARIQTVHREVNPRFHALLTRFKALTGCPVLINTSFNVRGEPIVESPEDAFRCFMGTGLDVLGIGNCVLRKERQKPELRETYHKEFALD
jgi:carbamoyltransferase